MMIIIIIIIIIIMSVVPLGTWVLYKSSPAFSAPDDKPEITPAVLPTFIQCSSSP
jgi:flagellar basal body-associated protein FliL